MTRRMLARRLRSRLQGERGFTIVETMVAITIMFGTLVSLSYLVTVSLGHQRVSRIRQTGSGLANQIMEQTRGLPYASIQTGMLATDLSGDSNIVTSCSGGAKLYACTATGSSIPGTAEPIVSSAGLTTAVPLVPHRSSTSPNADVTVDGVTYSWKTYVSQAPPTPATATRPEAPSPYRVTVEVSWAATGGVAAYVRLQSLFWSPAGCRSTATHPYAAPCQAFFYGQATVPQGTIAVEPTSGSDGLNNSDFDRAVISLPGVSASVQQEQIVESLAEFRPSSVSLTTDGTTTSTGGAAGSSSSDSDPNSTATTYARNRCGTEITCSALTASSPSSSAIDRYDVSLPASTSAESAGAVSAGGSSACPPTIVDATGQTDTIACAGAGFTPGGSVSSTITLGGTTPSLGTFTLTDAAVPTAASLAPLRAFADRVANPQTNGCTPGVNTDGCLALSASRTLGTIKIGGVPSAMPSPGGAWDGALVKITGYSDSATAAVGTGAGAPTVTGPASGSLQYWNGTGYTSIALTSVQAGSSTSAASVSGSIGGKVVAVDMTIDRASSTNAATATSSTNTTLPTPTGKLTSGSQSSSPVIVLRYQVTIQGYGQPVVDLTITVNPGTLDLDASFQPTPATGS